MQSVYKLVANTSEFDAKIRKSKQNLTQFANNGKLGMEGFTKAIGGSIASMVSWTAVIAGAAKVVGDIVRTNKEFEQSNANLAAVLGTTRDNITALTEDAKKLGASTMYTASQVTSLQTELAKLGFNQSEIKNATKDVLNFAAATGADLAGSASLCGAALRSFGLESKDMGRVASSMAVATSKSALSYEKLASSLSTVAPVAAKFGFSIEDTLALLGKLSDAGFDASSAATATRNIFLNMADSSGKLAQALGRPIKSLDDLAPALGELQAKGIDLAEMLDLTDKRSVAAFATLVSGSGKLTELRDSITNCDAALQGMVNEQMDTLQGATLIMQSAWEGLMLSFSDSVNGPLKDVVNSVTKVITKITELQNTGKLKQVFNGVTTTVEAATAAFIAYKVAVNAAAIKEAFISGIKKATTAIKSMNATLMANPYAAAAAALAAIGVAIYKITKESKELDNVTKTLDDVKRSAQENTAEEITKIEQLNNTLHDNTRSLDERRIALTAIQDLVPDYHGALTEEGTLINDNSDAISNYVAELQRAATAQAAFDKMVELQKKKLDAQQREVNAENELKKAKELDSQVATTTFTGGSVTGATMYGAASSTSYSRVKSAEQNLADIKKEEDEIDKEISALKELTDTATIAGDAVKKVNDSTTKSGGASASGAKGENVTFKFGNGSGMPEAGSLADLERRASIVRNSMGGATTVEEYKEMEQELEAINKQIDTLKGKQETVATQSEKIAKNYADAKSNFLKGGSQSEYIDALTAINLQDVVSKNGLEGITIPLEPEVTDEAWNELVAQINEQLQKLGIDPIVLDVQTGAIKEEGKATADIWGNVASAIGSVSGALEQLEDPGAKIASIVGQAIANLVMTFSKALQGDTLNTWEWIAAAAAGSATLLSTITSIKSVTSGYAKGGMILPDGSPYGGDNIVARLNAGEGVLTGRGIKNAEALAGQLQTGGMSGGMLVQGETTVTGEQIKIAYNNYSKRRGLKGSFTLNAAQLV